MEKYIRTLFAICLLVFAGTVSANTINGTINIGGGSKVITDSGGNAIGIDFNCATTCGGSVNMWPAPTGDFASLGGLSTNNYLDLYSFYFSEIPQKVIWEIDYGGLLYSFTLTSVAIADPSAPLSLLALEGSGYFNITNSNGTSAGFTATAGTWLYSQSGLSFSSQSSSSGTAVPEPDTIALLGLGLLGIGVASRLRKRA